MKIILNRNSTTNEIVNVHAETEFQGKMDQVLERIKEINNNPDISSIYTILDVDAGVFEIIMYCLKKHRENSYNNKINKFIESLKDIKNDVNDLCEQIDDNFITLQDMANELLND